ncbi:MAG: CoA-acylating methylmalonate-semialdehyde dehydrogenase [Candidatus Competibacterales bacterium]
MTPKAPHFIEGDVLENAARVPLFVNNEFCDSEADQWLAVTNPATQGILARVPYALESEVNQAVATAKEAFKTWREVPPPERARYFMKYAALLKEHQTAIAEILTQETGKTLADAKGDVWRGIEVVEQAANIPSQLMGETVENVARNIDTHSVLQPLGVCAGITPFNFPAMIPLWMFPLAIACGNTFVLKPSEQDPLTPTRLAELFVEAGFPPGLLQVVHGGKEQVDVLLTHPDVKAISFVGSVGVGQYIYRKGCEHLKRVQCMAGAKNHMVVMPDARKDQVISSLVGASCGAAGQRCMAISVAIFVGEAQSWIPDLKEAMAAIRPGPPSDAEAAYGPLISAKARERVLQIIRTAHDQGAEVLLDGSQCTVEGYPDGNWVGPTLIDRVTAEMDVYKEEIFGPVLDVVRLDSLEQAIEFINRHECGNGTSIFTASGAAARKFQHEIEAGQVGINLPIPVPLPFFSFTGWKHSFYGDLHAYGKQGVRFYTETKTILTRWFDDQIATVPGANMTIQLK